LHALPHYQVNGYGMLKLPIFTPEKTIYGSAELSEKPTVFLLLEKFSFVVQTQIFANEK